MTAEHVLTFAERHRGSHDHLYLLVDPLAGCKPSHPLSVSSLIQDLGEAAVERILRPDLAYVSEACPALVELGAPGQECPKQYLELSARYAQEDLAYNKRYVCGWLLSPAPLGAVARHVAEQCRISSSSPSKSMTPWYEPLRLELLAAALGTGLAGGLAPISAWLLPTTWGSYSILRGGPSSAEREDADLVRHTQHAAQLVSDFLDVWRLAQQDRHSFAPWRWTGAGLFPPQAGVHAFRLVRDAQQLGLRNTRDILLLSRHRVCIHPHLIKHPDIQRDIRDAANGIESLRDRFATYDDANWKRIAAALPRAENYS